MSLVYVGYVPHPPIIIPGIGRGEEKACQTTIDAFSRLSKKIIDLDVKTVVFVSPHAPVPDEGLGFIAGDKLRGDFSRFGAPEIKSCYTVDGELLKAAKEALPDCFPIRAELDHGVLVPLYFLKKAGWDGKIVVFSMPMNKPEKHGKIIGQVLNDHDARCALIASGDLSHKLKEDGPYGFHPSGPKFDGIIVKALKKDTTLVRGIPIDLIEEAGQCGYNTLLFALGAREGSVKVLSYEGPFGVGYLVAEIYRSSPIAGFARECLTYHLTAQPFDKLIIPGERILKEKRSCFVTLKKDGHLRGCIGTVQPVRENLASEIKHNSIAAGTQDPRFWPIQPDELPLISISVDILGEMEKISDSEGLDPERYGVVVRHGGKVGLLLPHLEGVDTVEHQLEIARQKAGIWPEEEVELWRFEVERYYE